MNERDLKNRINILNQQLILLQKYSDYFENIWGKKGVEKTVDIILDELILRRNQLKDYE